MKKSIKIVGIVLAVIIMLFGCFSLFIGTQVVAGSTQLVTNEETTGVSDSFWEKYGMDYEQFCTEFTIEELSLKSTFDGHDIPADYIYAPGTEGSKDNKTVILVHGLGGNRLTNYPVAKMFLDMGYSVITYDQRSSGENTAQNTTFGFWEKYDLTDYIRYVREQAPERTLGVWGTSFGGATAGLALGDDKIDATVDFLVLDCPVSSMRWMVEEEMRHMDIGLPVSYMTFCGNIINRIHLGFFYEEADVPSALSGTDTPVLIINSKADTLTPVFMGQDIYDAILSENKSIWTVEDSEHTDMWLDYNEEYVSRVTELVRSVEEQN